MMNSILLALLCASPSLDNDTVESKWELVRSDDTITVWKRPVAELRVDELRARIVVPAPRQRVWDLLEDANSFKEYLPYVSESKIVGRSETGGTYEYQLVDPPFVSLRDYTVVVETMAPAPDGTWQRHWKPANEQGPPKKEGVIRLSQVYGSWVLKDLGDGRTELTYQLLTDPAGSIPDWLARRANTQSLPGLLEAVRNRAVTPTWTP